MTTATAFEPRPYQDEAFNLVTGRFLGGERSTLVVHPTGLGKTILFGMVADWAWRTTRKPALVLAHRDVLIKQAVDKLERIGIPCVVEKADQRAMRSIASDGASFYGRGVGAVVASVQTLHKKRLESWPRDYFDLIVTDEAHHAPTDSYGRIYRHFRHRWHFGVTATGVRADGGDLGTVYGSVAHEIFLADAIRGGWLSPVVVAKCDQKVDLRGISTCGGDFNLGELEDRISRNLGPIVRGARPLLGDRPTVAFTPYVLTARAMADAFNQVGVSAKAVWGEQWDKEATLGAFHDGDFQVLVNVGVTTEGWDEPAVACVILARPTKSKGLLAQMIGRGTRLYEGKSDCQIIDFDWIVDEHKDVLSRPVDLMARPNADPEVLDYAAALVETGMQPDPRKAVEAAEKMAAEKTAREERADEDRKARQEREKLKVRVEDGESRLTWTREALCGVRAGDVIAAPKRTELPYRSRGSLAAQVAILVRYGVSEHEATRMTESEATDNILELNRRSQRDLSSLKQVLCLMGHGWTRDDAWRLTKAEASWEIDGILKRGRGR